MKCKEHGVKVYLKNGIVYCMACHEKIPLDKLKKK